MIEPRRACPIRPAGTGALVALALVLAAGCRAPQPPAAEADAPQVVAADGVLCDLTTTLAGSAASVSCLLEPGDDPHSFALTPSDREELEGADHVFINGLTLTPQLESLRDRDNVTWTAEAPGIKPVSLKDIGHADHHDDHDDEAHAGDDHTGHDHDGHAHGDQDPHVWHNPTNTAVMAGVISARLQLLAPDDTAGLDARLQQAQVVLSDLDAWAEQAFSTLPSGSRTLATSHRAFASLADRYDLQDLAVIGAHGSGDLLRPADLANLAEELRSQGVTILFPEQTPPGKALQTIASRTGLPLSDTALLADGTAPGSSLVATFVSNVCTIAEGLGGNCDRPAGDALIERWQAIRTER
ncbi:zinc ABC transporter substrate-binding protein [Synechococcus sp. RSCCF101]|uniref:metal ABC transporter substrate-binding protein n=1 Tax=Synechococcus sp. RSCCF101 TaxID=2511069 RepID=UPI001248CA52|nr:metal ABC transporter substrate-binding protein [Synechococcus sp. RSCCF101]QEY32752.1 zinc ABC transporter substrate-binding protein [Synechococcus sp. RSCCF101]